MEDEINFRTKIRKSNYCQSVSCKMRMLAIKNQLNSFFFNCFRLWWNKEDDRIHESLRAVQALTRTNGNGSCSKWSRYKFASLFPSNSICNYGMQKPNTSTNRDSLHYQSVDLVALWLLPLLYLCQCLSIEETWVNSKKTEPSDGKRTMKKIQR